MKILCGLLVVGFSPSLPATPSAPAPIWLSFREIMIYDANPDVRRAIFMAAPHRGSRKASNAIGKLGTALVRLPRNAVKNATTLNVDGLTELGKQRLTHVPDSIVEMRPQDPYLMAVLNEPLSPRVTYHSIIGRANPTDLLEESADKVDPYLSAHLEGAKTKKIVHASYTQVTSSPDALDEMRRILYQHIAQTVPAQ